MAVSIRPTQSQIKRLSDLAVPSIFSQVGTQLMSLVDIAFVGSLGVDALAGVSLGGTWVWGTQVFSLGVVLGGEALLSQAFGTKDHAQLARTLQQNMLIALVMSVPVMAIWWFAEAGLVMFGQDLKLAHIAGNYAHGQIFSLPAIMAFYVLRQYLQAQGLMTPGMWVVGVANLINIVADWSFIYGHLGLPALGPLGAGFATTVTQVSMLLILTGWIHIKRARFPSWKMAWKKLTLNRKEVQKILRLGVPIGVQMASEGWAFQIATLLVGGLGSVALAAHSLALSLVSFTYMVPIGISGAVITMVGNAVGKKDWRGVRSATRLAVIGTIGIQLVLACIFVLGRHVIPRLFTTDAKTISVCATVLPIAGAFQLFDGVHAVTAAALRGLSRTRVAAIAHLFGFYFIALPLGYWFAFGSPQGQLQGLWWGLAAGLAVVATVLISWLIVVEKKSRSDMVAEA